MINIFQEEFYWKGKLVVQTYHFKEELEKVNRSMEYVLTILNYDEHILISKRQDKYNVFYPFKDKYMCLAYVLHENVIILIHIKPTGRKPIRYTK